MIADDVVAALLQPARDLDGLVGADAAGDAERDQGHAVPTRPARSTCFATLPSFTSFCASRTIFSLPVVRGVQPAQQLPGARAGDDHELERVRYVRSGESLFCPFEKRFARSVRPSRASTAAARARPATIARSRSTHASSSSLTTT